MLNSFRTRNNCEQEAKFVQDRIISVERNIAELCHVFGQYSRKVARVRDKGDELAKVVIIFSESEVINKSLSNGLESFSQSVSAISDYGDARVQCIDSKVVQEFTKYEEICKHAKEETRQIFTAREKEIKKKLYLDRVKDRNPRNRQQIIQAETELLRATAEVTKTIHHLEEKTTAFERQKIHDIKAILLDFISIEMGFHAKALEILSNAFRDVSSIDEESDVEEFKRSLRIPDMIRHNAPKNSLFRASHSLGSLGVIFSTSSKKIPGIPGSKRNLSKSEDTLDSTRNSATETDDATLSDEEEEDEVTEKSSTDDKLSPFVVKKYSK